MRFRLFFVPTPMLACGAMLSSMSLANAQTPKDLRAERQDTVAYVLTQDQLNRVQDIRETCASGQEVNWIATRRSAGLAGLPDAADYCVTALTRLGRDGVLGFVRDSRSAKPTPALAFDSGFVTAFRQHGPVTSALPSMAAVKSIAERCLDQREPDTDLCTAAGYAFGARAAQGETVKVE